MDQRLKTVLAVVVGVVIGVTLLGGAFASHAVMRTVAFGGAANQGYGMMGPRQGFDAGQGMMGPRGGYQCGPQDGTGVCPNGGSCPGITEDATEL
jgi:hypothetical protein